MENRYAEFSGLISNINKSLSKIKSVEMNKFGLKGNQVQCLFYLFLNKYGLTSTKLCELCNEDKGAMSRTLDELKNKGLIAEKKEFEKKYKNPLLLTESGKLISKEINSKIENLWEQACLNIDKNKKELFYISLNEISNNLQKLCEKYGENDDKK